MDKPIKEAYIRLDLWLFKDLSNYNRFEAGLATRNFITDLDRLFKKHEMVRGKIEAGEFVPYDDDGSEYDYAE